MTTGQHGSGTWAWKGPWPLLSSILCDTAFLLRSVFFFFLKPITTWFLRVFMIPILNLKLFFFSICFKNWKFHHLKQWSYNWLNDQQLVMILLWSYLWHIFSLFSEAHFNSVTHSDICTILFLVLSNVCVWVTDFPPHTWGHLAADWAHQGVGLKLSLGIGTHKHGFWWQLQWISEVRAKFDSVPAEELIRMF